MDDLLSETAVRFLSFVDKTDTCWIWTGACDDKRRGGYGKFRHGARVRRAHRVAYELWVSELEEGGVVHHTCNVANCVNPDHLQQVSHQDNAAEMLGRRFYIAKIQELEDTIAALKQEIEEISRGH